MFTWTLGDRAKHAASRLTYGMANWRGLAGRKLAAESTATGATAAVVSCRFPPGAGAGPQAAKAWRRVDVSIDGTAVHFDVAAARQPQVVELDPGMHRVRVVPDHPPPYFETSVDLAAGRTVLIGILPASHWAGLLRRTARLRVWSADGRLDAKHDL